MEMPKDISKIKYKSEQKLSLTDIVGKGQYAGKDYRDDDGFWVVVHDLETWEKMGNKMPMNTVPYFVDKGMEDPDWRPMKNVFYPAREHTVSTTEPFSCVTPLKEVEKIEKRQAEIYKEIVDDFLEWHKVDFLERLSNVPDEEMFLKMELENWSKYQFRPDVIGGEKHEWRIIPKWIDEQHPTHNKERGNNQAKEKGRLEFFVWLKKFQLSDKALLDIVDLPKKEIYISPENIEPIYYALAPYFQGQEKELSQLLEGKAIEKTLIINGAIKHFAYSFCFLAMDNKIRSPKNDVLLWFCKYFVDKKNKPLNLGTIQKYFEHDDIKAAVTKLPNVKELIFDKQK